MKMGIVGLPNVGKSTLFNAITKAGAECCKLSILYYRTKCWGSSVPDERLDKLTQMYNPQKSNTCCYQFVDIAGLVKGASKGRIRK